MQGVELTSDEIAAAKARILQHLRDGYGRTFYGGCQLAAVSTQTAYIWKREDEDFAKAVDEARRIGQENALDLAENGIMKLLKLEDQKTLRWFLDRKGKTRGYIPKLETTLDDRRTPKIAEDATEEQLADAMAALRAQP